MLWLPLGHGHQDVSVPAGDTVGASGTRGALPVLRLDVIVFDYVYALGASGSGSYYYHPEVVLPPRRSKRPGAERPAQNRP